MEESPLITPVAGAQRIAILDVLRGFAVLGILLANIPFMAMAGAVTVNIGYFIGGEHWTDHASQGFVFLFADTKFVTLFSTLFGAGLALMSEKALATDSPFAWRYIRRLGALFLFGALHVVLLWLGDILLFYSLVGFAAMWFRKRRVKTLLVWAGIFLGLQAIMWGLTGLIDPTEMIKLEKGPDGTELSFEETVTVQTEEIRVTMSSGTFVEMVEMRLKNFAGMTIMMLFMFSMRTLGLFLIGMAAIKSGILNRFMADRKLLVRLLKIGLGIGMPLQVVTYILGTDMSDSGRRILFMSCWYFAGLLMALGYVALFSLWMQTNVGLGLRTRLAAVGRMALTNYLSHSLITTIIFNHCGQFDEWRRPYLLVLVFGIFAFQLVISPIWLEHFRYGPCEWLWRSVTYGRRMPMRRT